MKCELCPREAMRNDILCFLCSARFQEVIPPKERTAMDAPIGTAILHRTERIPDVLATDDPHYIRWYDSHKEFLK